ncbi:E3 ubiquitin-protein ligase lubel isoform X8 [Topomyia yanbarensis]|uniref:E3 ubiquitin-protein ligase lubel isoform X8 n=1 Tax=Topomyia yanbarensis TaxID=2498891 RepID=UPI00273B8B0E|nr:E3 ubiquitin-protein ligase lubel isoform X8 [Topomyia yanbarensis]
MSGNVPLRAPTPPAMANHPASRFKTSRTMPTWVTDSSDRVGPPPPAPPNNHDPEYEVIDVANQQYSNAPPPIPLKSPDIKRMTVMKCDLCGSVTPAVRCIQCDQNLFCASCDERYHRHPKRQTHTRTPVELQNTTVKPPLPPKGEASTGGPLPPPRRTKRPGSFLFPSPMLGRKQEPDQTIPTTVPQGPEVSQPQKPPQPPPSPALSLRDKMSSLKRFIHPSNRPLPDPPGQKVHSSNTSLNSTGASPFRSISSTMEKIQNNTAATLDRMTLLQQRYRQHQETMKADSDRSRRASVSSNVDLQSSGPNIRSKPPSVPTINHHHQQQQFHQQHLLHPRWNEPPTPRIRSGSVASDINLLPSASSTVSNESNPPRNNPPFMSPMQRSEFGAVPGSGPPNPRSTSVFNINQLQPQQPNMWGFTPLQQAQSMAHFNQMHWNQMNPWMPGQSQNGSNMSLNLPPSQMSHYPHDQPGYPSNWNNAWGGMYPYPMGMMPVMPGMALPPPRSRAHSRSRAASPALSIKSRKSTMSMRNMQRSSYINDLTDDEDSDEEFIKPRGRRDRRQRVDSNSSLDFDEPEPNTFIRASSVKHSRFNRDRRSGSAARSLIDYPTSHTRESHRTRYDRDELLRDRFDKMSLSSTRKTTNPSQGNDSDKEFNRNVSKQARSNNEDIGSPRKITSDSMTNDSDVDLERRRLAKHRTSSSAASPRRIASDSFTNDSDADSQRRKQQSKKSNKPTIPLPKRMESDSVTNDSDSIREKSKPFGIKKESDTEKNKSSKSTKSGQIIPKKIPSDSHTPDTDGEQRRRFNNKKSLKKHSSTEFIANDSDAEFERRKQEKLKKASVQELPEDKCSKISDDEEQETHMKTVELKNQLNETKLESIEVTVDTLPISAVAPNREWECEFCTYVNDAGVKICAICCKTVSAIITETKANTNMPRSPPPDVVQEPPFEKKLVSRPIDDVQKQEKISPVPTKEGEAKKKDNDDEKENGDDGGTNSVNEKVFDESQYENHEFNMQCSPSRSGCLKDSGEIKQNLDSEEVKIVNKLVKEKVSTGCGPSPPRESQKEPLKLQDNRQPTTPRASIGTSPPPQDMSTQTYDSFEQISEDISASQVIAQDKLPNNLTQPPPGSIFKRSHSIATTPQLLQVGGSRSGSRMSFSSDTQSLPPSPHEQSPQPPQQAQYHDTPQAIPNHSDENMSYLDRAIHQIIQTAAKTTFSLSRPLDQNKYRAMNDLRRIDVIQPNHPTAKDLLPNRQMTNTTMCDRSDDATRMMETLKIDGHTNLAGAELVYLLKEAEQHKFTAEELQAALGHCRDKHPIQWLHDNWSKLIDTVQTLATKYGHEKRENTIGTISSIEAREALRLHKGNIWHAITECIEQRQKKYNEIASKGNFTREDIVTSLTAHHGNLDLAMVELSKTQLKPFLMRIWGPPNGADNDSGNSLLQQALKEDRSGISSEIQEFISTHVENELLSNGSSNGVHAVNACSEKLEESKKITNRCPTTNGRAAMKPEDIQKFGNQGVSNDNPTVIDDECIPSNTAILRDIEKLIDQMEKNQANQNEDVLKNIQQLLTKLVDRNESRPASQVSPLNGTDFSKASTPSTEPGSSRSTPGPSSGNSIGSREGSVTSEQKRKLRKKYLETCFSDDYMTSDEDGDLTTVTESESRTIIRSLVTPYEPSEEPIEVQARRMLDEGHVQTYQQAELAVQLIEMRYARDNAIWAATQCHTIDEAKDLLQKECELCLGVYPMNEIISMLKCTHSCCLDCTKVYFTEEIMHRSITNCNCPYCKEPDLNNSNVTEDDVLEYFSNLDILLKNIVDEEVHDLFQRKLRDRTLMQDPNFKWCVNCSSGFFVRPRQKRLICPDCGSITCTSCRKPWEPQHEGISCEKFAEWKEANDPEFQAQGVARHLQAHGISCPNCNFKYSLSRGGCMHFTCIQCKFEFCFGCNKPFMMGAKCNVSPYCAKLGLHAHHPRNCLFYLRDKDPRDLQTLLTMHNVTFDTEPSELLKREFRQSELDSMKCPIPLQKETPAGLMDTVCNNDVPEAHAGLCRTHYVEYLVGAVSKAQIDPLPILDLTDCVQELRRRGIPLPERGPWDTDEIYREMCQKIVKEQIPLN